MHLRLEQVRLLVCTHAHSDHYGQAGPIVDRAGCELWMHPAFEHARATANDPAAALARRIEVAHQSGVPAEPLRRYAAVHKGAGSGFQLLRTCRSSSPSAGC